MRLVPNDSSPCLDLNWLRIETLLGSLANLVRYQQAYQAAAQVINVANSLFDTLLNAVRR